MIAYPEGETFFRRSSLTHGDSNWNFNAENENQFYQHALVEYVSNQAFAGGRQHQNYVHKRASYECKQAQGGYQTYFCYFKDLPISYGEAIAPTRRHTVNCESNANIYRDRDAGGSIRVNIAHVQLPKDKERYMWIDMVQPIRAIYLPVAWKSDESYQSLCTYLMINFTQRQSADIWRSVSKQFLSHPFSQEFGLGHNINHTLGIDVQEAYNLLILPRQLRTSDVYKSKIVEIYEQADIGTVNKPEQIRPYVTLDFAALASANYGVELQWRPYQWSSFVLGLLQNIAESLISMVPTVGPLLSASFTLGIKAISDPEGFREDFAGELTSAMIDTILDSAVGVRENMPDGFVKKKKSTRSIGAVGESSPLDFILDSKADQTRVLVIDKDKATLEREAQEAEKELESIGPSAWILASMPKEGGSPKHADNEEFCYDEQGCEALINA